MSFLKSLVMHLLPASGWSDASCHAVPLTTLSSSLALDDTNNSLLVPTPRPALPISAHSRATSPCPRNASLQLHGLMSQPISIPMKVPNDLGWSWLWLPPALPCSLAGVAGQGLADRVSPHPPQGVALGPR